MGDERVSGTRGGNGSGERGAAVPAATYWAAIGSQQADLPIIALEGDQAIALMMTIDLGVRFAAVAAAELARVLAPARPRLIVSVATPGITRTTEPTAH